MTIERIQEFVLSKLSQAARDEGIALEDDAAKKDLGKLSRRVTKWVIVGNVLRIGSNKIGAAIFRGYQKGANDQMKESDVIAFGRESERLEKGDGKSV